MAFQHITPQLVLASVQAIAAGKQPAIDADLLLAHHLPEFLGLKSEIVMDDLTPLPLEYRRLQRRFHAQAVASWGVLGRGSDFVLIPLGPSEWASATEERDAAIAKGFYLCGTIGTAKDGTPLILEEPEPDADSLRTLLHACLVSLWPKANEGSHGRRNDEASVAWLSGLWDLPDTRTESGGTLPN